MNNKNTEMPKLASQVVILRQEKKREQTRLARIFDARYTAFLYSVTFALMLMRYFRCFNFNKIHNGRWCMRPSKDHSWYNYLSFLNIVLYNNA